jgi:putative peptide zinc metalloprotease protein
MAEPTRIFDESWHKVRSVRVRLVPGVELVRQRFRGQWWYVVCDLMGHRYFRIRPEAYAFICHLNRMPDVESAWKKALEEDPHTAPGQGEVVQLLSQLFQSGLLLSDRVADVAEIFKARRKEHTAQVKQRWASLLFLKIPLINPDPFLRRTVWLVGWAFGPLGLLLWLAALGWGVQSLVVNWGEFRDGARSLLGVSNLPWLYLALILTKGLHEFGHAYACRRYGREVPEMGIMLLIFNPLPYMDASASYALAEKYRRVLVGAAGMLAELFVAGLALVFWAHTGDGIANRLAYNVAITASVATLLFNLNPLLRFDGYHILTDWLEVPNLQQRSQRMVKHWIERHAFGLPPGPMPAESRGEAAGFALFFVASWTYRVILLSGILLFISQRWLIAGVLLAVAFAVWWGVVPLLKGLRYLLHSPRLMNHRPRALGVTAAFAALLFGVLFLVPVPYAFRASGIVRSVPYASVFAGTHGQLVEILTPSGETVEEGQPLLRLTSRELEEESRLVALERARIELLVRTERSTDGAQLAGLEAYRQALAVREGNLEEARAALLVRAPVSGRWVAPLVHEFLGSVVPRGASLGFVRGEKAFAFTAVVPQRDVDRLFARPLDGAELKLRGREGETLSLVELRAIPAEQSELPSAALGMLGGGSVSVDVRQPGGGQTREPFFEVRGIILLPPGDLANHGQRGTARFPLPATPLGRQWARALRQLFLEEYRL